MSQDDELEKMLAEKAALEAKIQAAMQKKNATESAVVAPSTADIMDGYFKEVEDKPDGKPASKKKSKSASSINKAKVQKEKKGEPDFFDNAPTGKQAASPVKAGKPPQTDSLRESTEHDPGANSGSAGTTTQTESLGGQKERTGKKGIQWGKVALDVGKMIGQGAKVAVEEIGKVLDDVEQKSQEEAKLKLTDVTWYTKVDCDTIYESLYKTFTTKPIGVQHRWQQIKPVSEYNQIIFEAKWQENSDNWTFWSQVNLELTVTAQQDRTAVHCHFTRLANNMMNNCSHADQLIRNTNWVVRELCNRG